MTTLHPHWQETDDAPDRRVRITSGSTHSSAKSSPKQTAFTGIPKAKRGPAAFAGIALFIIGGFAMFHGFSEPRSLLGQVSASKVTIHIKPTGADPLTATVQPGWTISWKNDDTIPHVLASDTFPSDDGRPFATSAIFPGSSTHVLVPLTAKPGTYAYISKTAESIGGQIVVEAAAAALPPAAAPVAAPATVAAPVVSEPVQETQPTPTAQPVNTAIETFVPSATTTADDTASVTSDGIPLNPHTVGSGEAPLPERQGKGIPAISKVVNRPASSPETGSELWVVIILSIGSLLFVTRKAFQSV